MNREIDEPFLRAILAAPGDESVRLVYADWLDDHGEHSRAAVLRGGKLEFGADPGWLRLMETFGRPFEPDPIWQDEAIDPPDRLFREAFGKRGGVYTFESAFRGETTDLAGLASDLAFITSLELGNCFSGASSNAMLPFLAELLDDRPLTGSAVLAGLKVHRFRCQHIENLDAADIPAPGYQPNTLNDEVHTDPNTQYLFWCPDDAEGAPGEYGESSRRLHAALRGRVEDGKLWYVLLHTWDEESAEDEASEWAGEDKGGTVVLFAVGRSRFGRRLLGVVTCQTCHNLCD